ncbi:MAG: sigma-70 family RNA polymerase sigma factor [Caldilineaceae bacterium]|nr:sigma-70 family RNA polymerase sigma factor [Caldilineaceae bacterium]
MTERTNAEWVAALTPPPDDAAVNDLRALLLRGLSGALGTRGELSQADFEDFAQDALLKIMDSLSGFRGESRFTTWAQKITVRVALSELRRKRWRDRSLDGLMESGRPDQVSGGSDFTPGFLADQRAGPEQQAVQNALMRAIQQSIQTDLSERQRRALTAVMVQGMPMEEVVEQMGTNRNALYKLLHDARKRLKQALLESGLSVDEILGAFE